MTPNFINSSTNPFHLVSNDHHHHHQLFGTHLHHHQSASSSSYSCHFHFNSTPGGYYLNDQLYQSQQKLEGKEYAPYGGSYESENNKVGNGLKLSPDDERVGKHEDHHHQTHESNQAKCMSSKMRLKQKMKSSNNNNNNYKGVEIISSNTTIIKIREDHHQKQASSSMETDYSSNSSSNTPVRVCSDCNTTKTPLWRSGPNGPKSLCNACGIRQRKARRAMAAAAAAANDDTPLITKTPTMKIKVHHKEKIKNNNDLTVPFKKRCKVTATGSPQEPKKLGFEDHLINLSKKLAFHHVLPQDEKEAAILLMALSCGLVHG